MEIKEKVFEFIKNNKKIIIICASILFIVTIPVTIILNNNKEKQDYKQIVYSDIEKEDVKEEVVEEYIYVDIKGMVKNPGIYMMNSKDRVNDVINKSGGLLKGANTRYTNLSKKLTDEMVIVIYSESEIEDKLAKIDKVDEVPCLCESSISESFSISESIVDEVVSEDVSNGLVNINTASKDKLMTLTGIGESKALAIIEYRKTNNGFKSKEELMEVSGIGESTYNKIKDLITTE